MAKSSTESDRVEIKNQTFGPIKWAWGVPGITAIERLLLLKLADFDHLNKETHKRKGTVWPTQLRLAQELGVDPKTISATLKSLEAKTLIARTGEYAKEGGAVKFRMNYGVVPNMSGADGASKLAQSGFRTYLDDLGLTSGAIPESTTAGSGTTPYPVREPRRTRFGKSSRLNNEEKAAFETSERVRRVPHLTNNRTAPLVAAAPRYAPELEDASAKLADDQEHDLGLCDASVADEGPGSVSAPRNSTRSTASGNIPEPPITVVDPDDWTTW